MATGPVPGRYRFEIRVLEQTDKKVRHPLNSKETVDEVVGAVPKDYNAASTLERPEKRAGQ